jgi:ribosome recycling factor
MSYNFSPFKQSIKEAEEWLRREYSSIRTGRATPAILDVVKVEAYGSEMSIPQIATVSIEDARMLRISPWDSTQTKAIEKGLQISGLGLSVVVDDKGLRVMFPELTSDRRQALIKIAKQKLEDARVTLRTEREKVLKELDKQKKEGSMSEDDQFRLKSELQKMVDDTSKTLEEIFNKKEKEITE